MSAKDLKWADLHTFKRYLHEIEQVKFPKMLVVFEIKGVSKPLKKQVVAFIFEALENLLKKYEIATHLEHEKFALLFQGYDPHFVQLFMHHFLKNVYTHLQEKVLKEPFSIYEALTLLTQGESATHIFQYNEKILQLAHKQENRAVNMRMDPLFTPSKEVFLFQDGGPSLEFIGYVFKERGFTVKLSTNFEECLPRGTAVPLYILTDSFVEAKGLQFFITLMDENHIQIPILQLSLPDKDTMLHLFNSVNYFDAPFGLIIFLTPVS